MPDGGGEQCFADLQRCQGELAKSLEVLSRTSGDIDAALERMPAIWPELRAVPQSGASFSRPGTPKVRRDADSAPAEKFQLSKDGVPTFTAASMSRKTPFARKRTDTNSLGSSKGVRLLDDWMEGFVICEQEATNMYTTLYGEKIQSSKAAFSSVRSSYARIAAGQFQYRKLLAHWNRCWEIITLILVVMDMVLIPITLAWPASATSPSPTFLYFQAGPIFWSGDILMCFVPALRAKEMKQKVQLARRYVCSRFPIDLSLVVLDIVLLLGVLAENFRVFTLLRLIRVLKLKRVLTAFENRLAAGGNMKGVPYLIILQCIATVLAVNHVLACLLFYVGRMGILYELPNWIDSYRMMDQSRYFQYMICFNWVIAEYTPAPFPFQPQNELEQGVIIAIILTCLPLLGAQIGKIGGTLNTLKEKARERDMVVRDLQRWLQKKKAPGRLTRRMLSSLGDVLDSKDSPLDNKEPMALKFLPSSMLDELRIVKMSQKLGVHPLFYVLMDDRLGLSGRLSAVFQEVNAVQGHCVFTLGRPAEGLYITQSGLFALSSARGFHKEKSGIAAMKSDGGDSSRALIEPETWLAEMCLYTNLNHSATLAAKVYSKVLTTPVADFVQAIRSSPAAVVALHEYAVRLLKSAEPNKAENWEILQPELADESVQHTQLAELLVPGTGRVNALRSAEETDFTNFLDDLLKDGLSNQERIQVVKQYIPELRENGIYAELGVEDEANRAILSMLSTVWILKDDYESMVDCQKVTQRLSKKTFGAMQVQLIAMLVLLALRGLSKNADLAKLCPPSERRTPEQVLEFAVKALDAYLPSIANLPGDCYDHLVATVRMLGEFNFAQLLQGENNPHSIWQLQMSLADEGEDVFQTFLFVQVSILCGVTGNITLRGSMFLSELNGRSVLKGLACLQDIQGVDPSAVYWRYIASRAESLELVVQTPSHLVLARLACLTRTLEAPGLRALANDWDLLTDRERDALSEIFLTDGHYDKAFIFLYLPLFLTNTVANKELGLRAWTLEL